MWPHGPASCTRTCYGLSFRLLGSRLWTYYSLCLGLGLGVGALAKQTSLEDSNLGLVLGSAWSSSSKYGYNDPNTKGMMWQATLLITPAIHTALEAIFASSSLGPVSKEEDSAGDLLPKRLPSRAPLPGLPYHEEMRLFKGVEFRDRLGLTLSPSCSQSNSKP